MRFWRCTHTSRYRPGLPLPDSSSALPCSARGWDVRTLGAPVGGVLCSCKHVQTGDPNASGKSQWKRFAGVKEFVQTAGVNGFQPNTTFASEHKCMLWDGLDLD